MARQVTGKGFSITGVEELKAALRRAGTLATDALEAAGYQEAERIMAEAKEQTPVDTGALRGSGAVLPPNRVGKSITIEMGFGGAAKDYAVPVHERLDVHHPTGTAKFLEKPFLAAIPAMPARLAVRVRAALERLRS